MAPRLTTKALINSVDDGDAITIETVKRIGGALFTHIYEHDLTISVGSTPDRPDGQFISADIFEGGIGKAFHIDAARVPRTINALLAYVKITSMPVAICSGDPDTEDTDVIVILVVHPGFDRKIYAELAAHERSVRLRTTDMFAAVEKQLEGLAGAVERIEGETGEIIRKLDESVIPSLG